jgi:arginyl-tRNA synthetase
MKDIILKALQEASGETDINLEFPENDAFGDYTTNVAMVSGKKAEEMVEKLKKDTGLSKLVSKIEIKEPGFINFFLSQEALIKELGEITEKGEKYGSSGLGEGKTVVIDYSSPNIAKRFGIGHLRSTVIGQALYNLYSTLGYKVIGDNHLGDWGTQFGVLLYQIESKGLKAEDLSLDKLEELYVEFHQEAEKETKLWEEARGQFKKLEEGDKKAREVWKKLVEVSMKEFDKIYALLGVKFDYAYGESFYEDYMPKVLKTLEEKGLAKKSQGAQIMEFPDLPPAMLVKSDGATTYFTRDLATILFRIGSWDPQLVIYEVGMEQTLHFRQVFAAAKLLGWAKDREFVHICHGLIRFEHGKMSTRKGETIKLEAVLAEAGERAFKKMDLAKKHITVSAPEEAKIGLAVGIGAIKYNDLKRDPKTDIVFDWDEILNMEGNSAPYLQYTVVRTNSVMEKAGKDMRTDKSITNTEESSVLRSLVRYPEIIKLAAESYSPNLLCNHLFGLAQKYNNFYNKHRILGEENEGFRLSLSRATGQVLKNGLQILGIQTPERM